MIYVEEKNFCELMIEVFLYNGFSLIIRYFFLSDNKRTLIYVINMNVN